MDQSIKGADQTLKGMPSFKVQTKVPNYRSRIKTYTEYHRYRLIINALTLYMANHKETYKLQIEMVEVLGLR